MRGMLLFPPDNSHDDGEILVTILRTRILRETAQLPDETSAEIRGEIIRLMLELLYMQDGPSKDYVLTQLCNWLRHEPKWRTAAETVFADVVSATLRF